MLISETPAAPADPELPRENVFGHVKKARLMRDALTRLRTRLGRGLRVLDVGCGNGTALTRFLSAPGDVVLGIDTHAPSVEHAQRHFGRPGLEFRVAELNAVGGEPARFDAVVFADVLEHVDDPGRLLVQGRGLLRGDGRVLVTVPNGHGPFEIESRLSRLPGFGGASLWAVDRLVAVLNRYVFPQAWNEVVVPTDLPYNAESGHIQFFTLAALQRAAGQARLVPVRKAGLSWLSGPYTNYLFAPSRLFCAVNTRLADVLPFWMLSAWFFELARAEETDAPTGPTERPDVGPVQ
jgi:SAM-dependent methyltransferase